MSEPTPMMPVKEIMSVNVVTMPPDATVFEVAKSMTKIDIGSIVIVEAERAIGIITETDIVTRVVAKQKDPKTTKAKEVMSSPLIHITPNTALTEAMRVMTRAGIRRVAILKNDSLAGIITSRDILRWSPELIDVMVESLRLKSEQGSVVVEEEDELIAYGGVCDVCGEYSIDLALADGEYICEVCRR